jgi:hypothetical protein
MKSNSLKHTNRYLKDPVLRKKLISRSVRTSSGVEGIQEKANKEKIEIPRRTNKKIYNTDTLKPKE